MINQLLCKFKGHDFSSIQFKPLHHPEYHEKTTTCIRCGLSKSTRDKHTFIVEESDINCTRRKKCSQCGEEFELPTIHKYWDENGKVNSVKVETSEPCVVGAQQCIRCGNIRLIWQHQMKFEKSVVTHHDPTCTVSQETYSCTVCGFIEEKQDIEHHDW